MSRIGNQPVLIPEGVTVEVSKNQVTVKGPKGALAYQARPELEVKTDGKTILVSRKKNDRFSRSLHGLTRALLANLVVGVTEGYSKTLKLVGTGYRAELKDKNLVLSVGFSHPVVIEPTEGLDFQVVGKDTLVVSGIDKVLVGQMAAKIRAIRPPEPYKGKGIRYEGEEIRKKAGKAGKAGAAGFSGQ